MLCWGSVVVSHLDELPHWLYYFFNLPGLVLDLYTTVFTLPDCTQLLSLVPRPHPQEGKGSGELGPNAWACAVEYPRANQIAALAQSYDLPTTGMQQGHCLLYKFELPTYLADQSDLGFGLMLL